MHKADFKREGNKSRLLRIFSKGIRECHLYHSNHLISTIIIIDTTSIGSPPFSAKGSIPSYLVGNFNHFNYWLSMISECVTKSSITADMAFRKIYPCRGVQLFAHTCQRLLMPDQTSSFGGRQRVDGYTLFMRISIHDSSGNCSSHLLRRKPESST